MVRGGISDGLKDLFLSFNVDIPYDSDGKSFVRNILNEDLLRELVSEIRNLSDGVLITKENHKMKAVKPKTMLVYEIEIGGGIDELSEKTDYFIHDFFESKEENIGKIMLVFSESLGMIDAKMSVYRKYKDHIDANDIFLLHAYENYDEIAKSIAFKKLSSYSSVVGELKDTFSKESLERVINRAIAISLTRDHITRLCYEVYIQYKEEYVGSADSGQYNCYSTFTVQAIKQILAEETLMKTAQSLGSRICHGILKHVESVVQTELSNELGNIRYQISHEIYRRIEDTLIGVIINFFKDLSGWIANIVGLFVRVFYPVDVNSESWRSTVANEIYIKIQEKQRAIADNVLKQIQNICWKTTEDLKVIDTRLEQFRTKVFPEDKKQLITEWSRRDIIHDKSALEKHPSIMKYIAGHRGDQYPVVKVFLRDDKEKDAQLCFKNACRDLDNTEFEFVNLAEKSTVIQRQAEEITLRERVLDIKTRNELKKIIQEHGGKIYATYSNVVGMRIGKVICAGDEEEDNPCIVLYCLDKNLIPFGEKPLPKTIAGWPCDIREDYVMFGHCPKRCPASRQSLPEPGCSIGIPSVDSSGSVGFLVEPKNPTEQFRCGFLTASHVAVKRFKELNHYKSLLSMNHLSLEEHPVVHPSWQDNDHVDYTVGQVVESFCGNYGLCQTGLDFALVRSHDCREEVKEALQIVKDEDLTFDGKTKVMKLGRTTEKTFGELTDDSLSIKVPVDTSCLSKGYIDFFNCYAIKNIAGKEAFFSQGDSGSGVFVEEKDTPLKPLGIAFASLLSQTAVCKIDTIVNKLDLTIVRYTRTEDETSSSETKNTPKKLRSEPMECA